jgi:hypothetical protein
MKVQLTALAALVAIGAGVVTAQVDQRRAAEYFKEAAALCERDGGKLWGVSLCGPIAIGDPATKTIATSEPAPPDKPPPALGFANAALEWGGRRWVTISWPLIPQDPQLRQRLLIHELFHRVQPGLKLLSPDGDTSHLDGTDARYWMRLEWRALAAALAADGEPRRTAIAHALAFRRERRALTPPAAEGERILEINEGLAQYTGTIIAAGSRAGAIKDAIAQLAQAEQNETFVRTFPYPSGAAYGLLLDDAAPAWRTAITANDDLGGLLATAARVTAAADAGAAASAYDGAALKAAEIERTAARQKRLAEMRQRFVDGPVVVLPRSGNNSYITNGMTPIPGEGIVYPRFRATAVWGTLVADAALLATDRSNIRVPGPATVDGSTLRGPGWTVELAPGWTTTAGPRPGDLTVVTKLRPIRPAP